MGQQYSHIIHNLEDGDLRGNGSVIQESLSEIDEGGAEVLDLFINLATDILQETLPCRSHIYNGKCNRRRGRTELNILCVRVDKVAATADVPQHEHKNISLFGLRSDILQRVCCLRKIKCIVYSVK
jgi:hypothetical protein